MRPLRFDNTRMVRQGGKPRGGAGCASPILAAFSMLSLCLVQGCGSSSTGEGTGGSAGAGGTTSGGGGTVGAGNSGAGALPVGGSRGDNGGSTSTGGMTPADGSSSNGKDSGTS